MLNNRKLPPTGWHDATIERLLNELALMDSNTFVSGTGVGEREGRLFSGLVARMHSRMAHGIGRSGDISASQPKAAGSSVLSQLCRLLALDALHTAGLRDCSDCAVLPLATGMAMTNTLLAIATRRPLGAKYVIWSRIDQKTCVKCITAANLELVSVEQQWNPESCELQTNVQDIQHAIERLGPDKVACVVSTTSCFAPRNPDQIEVIAKLCDSIGVPHLINNAYGVQAKAICDDVTKAWRRGRVDAVVQSTDKNFMVPVGGSIVCEGPSARDIVSEVATRYPGRASVQPTKDLFITLLSMGKAGFRQLLSDREQLNKDMREGVWSLASELGERPIGSTSNPISMGITLNRLDGMLMRGDDAVTALGSMLFARGVTGARTISGGKSKAVSGYSFDNYGASANSFRVPYITFAAAIGGSMDEFNEFVRCASEARKKM